MGRVYSGRNSESLSGYKLIRQQLRGRNDLSVDQLGVIALYAKASDDPGKSLALKASAADMVGRLSTEEKSAVNAILSNASIEGVS